MTNEVKITITADGSGLKIATDDGQVQFVNLGKKAKEAGEQASSGIDAVIQKMGQMQSAAVTVAQTLAGVFVVDKIVGMVKEMALLNARYETLGVAMRVVGENAGYTGAQMDMAARGMQAMGISMVESRQQAMRLVQAHIDLANSQKLARIAQDAAVIGNMNSSDAFAAMIHGISTGQTDVLRTIGLNVSMEQSYKAMADTLHKHQDELTQNERTQGVLNSVMKAGADIAGTYEAAMDTAGKQINSMKRYTEDLKTVQGEVFNEVLTVAVMAYTSHLKESNAEVRALAANGELKAWGMELAQVFVGVANAIDNMVTGVKMVGNWAAQRNVAGDITDRYQQKLDALGNAPDVWKQRGELVAQRDSEIKASLAMLDEANVELGKRADRFQNAFDARQQALASKAATEAAAVVDREKFLTDTMAFYQDQRAKGMLKEADYVKTMNAFLLKNYGQGTPDYKDTTPAPKAHALTEYQRLIKAINEKTEADLFDIQTQGQLTAAQKESIKTLTDMRDGTLKLTQAEAINLGKKLELRFAAEQQKIAGDAATKQMVADVAARAAARNKEYDGINAYMLAQEEASNAQVKASNESLKAAQELYDQYGKSKSQIAEITLLTLEKKQAEKYTPGSAPWEDMQKQIDNQRKLIVVLQNTEGLDAQKSMWSSIEQTAHSTFTNIFQGGQDLWTKLRNTGQSIFVDWLYQLTVKRWIFDISASTSGSGVAAAAIPGMAGNSAGVSSLGSLGNIVSGISAFGGMAGETAKAILTGNMGMTEALTVGFDTLGTSLADGLGMIGGALGVVGVGLGALSFLKSAMDYKITPTGNALTATLSANGIPSGQVGTRADFKQEGGLFGGGTTNNSTWGVADAGTTQYISDTTKAGTAAIQAYAKAIGLSTDAVDGFTKSIDVSITGMDATQAKAAIDKAIGGFFDEMVSASYASVASLAKPGEAASATLQRLATDFVVVNRSLDLLGYSALKAGTDSAKAAASIVDAFGGLDKLNASVGYFYEHFFSESERAAKSAESAKAGFAQLNIDMPTSKEAYRKLVEDTIKATDANSASSRKFLADLLSLAPAFDSVANSAVNAATAASQAAAQMAQAQQSAIQNWGTPEDMRQFKGQQLLDVLAKGGLQVDMSTINAQTKDSVLSYYKTADAKTQALLRDNQQAIFDYVNTKQVATGLGIGGSAGGGGGGGSDSGAGGALSSALNDWTKAAQDIRSTMADLQKTLVEISPDSYAKLEAQFAITKARDKAGDIKATQDLPALAKSLIDAGKDHSGSALEQAQLTARVLASLDESATAAKARAAAAATPAVVGGGSDSFKQSAYGQMYEDKTLAWLTAQNSSGSAVNGFAGYHVEGGMWVPDGYKGLGSITTDGQGYVDKGADGVLRRYQSDGGLVPYIPKLDVGTNYVPRDMLAMIHEGEAVVPKAYNPALVPGSNGASTTEQVGILRAIADWLELIAANTQSGAISAAKQVRMFEHVIPDDDDVLAVRIVVPKGEFVPVRAV